MCLCLVIAAINRCEDLPCPIGTNNYLAGSRQSDFLRVPSTRPFRPTGWPCSSFSLFFFVRLGTFVFQRPYRAPEAGAAHSCTSLLLMLRWILDPSSDSPSSSRLPRRVSTKAFTARHHTQQLPVVGTSPGTVWYTRHAQL